MAKQLDNNFSWLVNTQTPEHLSHPYLVVKERLHAKCESDALACIFVNVISYREGRPGIFIIYITDSVYANCNLNCLHVDPGAPV